MSLGRREFLAAALGGAAASASGQQRLPGDGIRLGFDSYSVRAFRWKDIQLLDYAAGLKLDAIQFSSMDDYHSLDPAHLRKVKEHAERVGIAIDGGTGCICPISKSFSAKDGPATEVLIRGIKTARAVGASSMRCFMGSKDDRRSGRPIEEFMDSTIKTLRSAKTQAQDLGVRIALENHAGDMRASEVKTIITEAGTDFVGACLDTGNPMWVMEDPQVTLETLGPYVVTTHVRDSVIFEVPRGAAAQWVALGDGCSIDFPRFLALYQELCPKAVMQLEIITGRPPETLPYYEAAFWKFFPKMPAAEFARFAALAKNGHAFMGSMVIEDSPGEKPPEFRTALKEQQRFDLERSFEYAKKILGVGVRWKNS